MIIKTLLNITKFNGQIQPFGKRKQGKKRPQRRAVAGSGRWSNTACIGGLPEYQKAGRMWKT
jgi:hypothetical protein